MNAFRVQVEEEELLVDVLKSVLLVVDRPFGVAVVFLAVGAAVVIDVAFKACTFMVAFIPFTAKGAALHAASPVALLVQLVVNDHIVHLLIFNLFVNIHQDDIRFDILGAFAGQVHVFVGLQKRLLQVNINGIGNLAFLDFVKHLLGRNKDDLVAFFDGVTKLVSHIIQALLHVNMHRVGAARHKVHANTHVPFTCATASILVDFAERIFADTVDKHDLRVKLRHERFFFIDDTTQTPEVRIQAKHFGKGLVAIERREQRIIAGILFLEEFRILRGYGHVAKTVTFCRFRHRGGK